MQSKEKLAPVIAELFWYLLISCDLNLFCSSLQLGKEKEKVQKSSAHWQRLCILCSCHTSATPGWMPWSLVQNGRQDKKKRNEKKEKKRKEKKKRMAEKAQKAKEAKQAKGFGPRVFGIAISDTKSGRSNSCRARGNIPRKQSGPATRHVRRGHVMCLVQVSEADAVQTFLTIQLAVRIQLTFSTKGLRSETHPCGAMLLMELQRKLLHMSLYVKQLLQLMWVKWNVQIQLGFVPPRTSPQEVRSRREVYVAAPLVECCCVVSTTLHFKAYIFEIENTSLSPTGWQTDRSIRSK